MKYGRWLTGVVLTVVFGTASLVAGEDPTVALSDRQRKEMEKLRTNLEALPPLPNAAKIQLQSVQDQFRTLLAINNKPNPSSTDTLAATLARGINGQQISVSQALLLSRELVRALDQRTLTYRDVNSFVARIDPLVRGTGLSGPEKTRVYREAIRVLQTAPTYIPNR